MKKLKPGDSLIITWVDICGHGGWTDLEQAPEPVSVEQICYYVGRRKDHLLVAQGFQNKDLSTLMAPTAIPLGVIKSIKRVK